MNTKTCTKCGEAKPATTEHYVKKSSSRDGLATECKVCKKLRDRAHYETNKEEILKRIKKYTVENPEIISERKRKYWVKNRDVLKSKRKAYYESNKEEILAKQKIRRDNRTEEQVQRERARKKAYYDSFKDTTEHKARQKLVRESRKDYMTEYQKQHANTPRGRYGIIKRSAKQRGLVFELNFARYEQELWGKPCHYCNAELIDFTGLDRVDNGGGYTHDNVVPCCSNCNTKKQDIPYDDFMTRLAAQEQPE